MKKELRDKKIQVLITTAGTLVILLAAIFCYRTVEQTIVDNEKESIISIAKVSAHSFEETLQAKSNLVYAALSGDMEDEQDIKQNLLKIGEKGRFIPFNEKEGLKKWENDACTKAGENPGEVIAGPVLPQEEEGYVLYLTKAVYMNRSIAGYVQIELNLEEIYEEEQGLSGLKIGNHGYCVVKKTDGTTIMADGDKKEEEISFSRAEKDNCELVWSYEVVGGTPKRTQKLLAYDTVEFRGEKFILCIIEDYDEITAPIKKIVSLFSLLGIALLLWIGIFSYRIFCQRKEEEQLKVELDYEKELNKANQALKNQENLMQKYNHSSTMTVLTGALAHEFNNLMTPIVLYSELLEENETVMEEMPDEVHELAISAKRCEELARQLLDYSRQGRAEKVLMQYNATFAVQSSVSIVNRLLPENIRMETSICKTAYYIRGQIGTLNQVILNLVTNAIHAIGKKDGRIRIQFGLSIETDRMVRLIVEDNGEGIPEEVLWHIFEPFYTTKKEKEGTGIGLTVVKRLVEEHGGLIQVRSTPGKGTIFVMDFPKEEKEAEEPE